MSQLKRKNIFIIDDDAMLTETLSDYITREVPHKVSIFSTGEECLDKIEEAPDIIILDYYLNTVNKDAANGMEILKSLRKLCPESHIIMFSNQEQYNIALQTIQKGALEYVIKDENAFKEIASIIEGL
ncbi:MAG TPA: response regulator [Edaphocola sp.]|nr:response regulator [Edaphocola sp.]